MINGRAQRAQKGGGDDLGVLAPQEKFLILNAEKSDSDALQMRFSKCHKN